MKKDLIFSTAMLAIGALLFLYGLTGAPAHIAISMVGIFVLAVYTAATRKSWKIPVLEIFMRAFYGIALISGIVIMNIEGIVALEITHKASAALFVVFLIVLFVHKFIASKKVNN